MKRMYVIFGAWAAVGLGYLFSTDVRASLWATGVITTTPDTWVAQLLPTGSMEPTLNEHDWLVFRHVPLGLVRPGDIISFYCPLDGVPVTHRVTRKLPDGRVITRGDNNPCEDPWIVDPEHYRGLLMAVYPGD